MLRARFRFTEWLAARAGEEGFQVGCAGALTKMLGVRAGVEVVPPGTFPRTDFKARRVIDDRDLFRGLAAALDSGRGDV